MSSSLDLQSLFNSVPALAANEEGNAYKCALVHGFNRYRIGRDLEDYACVLISEEESPIPQRLSIILEHLEVRHSLPCRIIDINGSVESGRFTIIRCTSHDSVLQVYFFEVITRLIESVGNRPDQVSIGHFIESLVELFRALSLPPRKSLQGLWAELFIIRHARKPSMCLDAWHATPEDRYDFNKSLQRVEVKSSATRQRRHHFSLEQLAPVEDVTVVIASLFVERSGGGLSVSDLASQIRLLPDVSPELCLTLDRQIAMSLGSTWRSGASERFDVQLAANSLRFIWAVDIPAVPNAIPPQVSNVSFASDCSASPVIPYGEMQKRGELLESVLPQR